MWSDHKITANLLLSSMNCVPEYMMKLNEDANSFPVRSVYVSWTRINKALATSLKEDVNKINTTLCSWLHNYCAFTTLFQGVFTVCITWNLKPWGLGCVYMLNLNKIVTLSSSFNGQTFLLCYTDTKVYLL